WDPAGALGELAAVLGGRGRLTWHSVLHDWGNVDHPCEQRWRGGKLSRVGHKTGEHMESAYSVARADSSSELSCRNFGDDVENSGPAPSQGCIRPAGPASHEENTMAKYLLLKHYRGAPAPVNDVPMDQWTPD